MNTKSWDWRYSVGLVCILATTALGWSYWPTFVDLAEEWAKNPLYSHGYLVPLFSAFLLWMRREQIPSAPLRPSWWALAFLALAAAMRLGAAHFYYSWPDRGSLLVLIFGAALAIGGWAAIRWSWPSILFLAFMIPFPGFVESGLIQPLRRIATVASTNSLQTLGFFAQADGNVIVLSETNMGIEDACSGLNMLSTFVAMTVGASFLMRRPGWQKGVIVLSSIPIALVCNVVRITCTGIWNELGDPQSADVFHDVAGYLMPLLALVLLLAEFKFLDFIFVIASESSNAQAPPVGVPPVKMSADAAVSQAGPMLSPSPAHAVPR